MEYVNIDSEYLIGIEPISSEEAEALGRDYLSFTGLSDIHLSPALIFPHIAVYLYKASFDGQVTTGWLTGGLLPHMCWRNDTMKTPIEVLATYCGRFIEWIHQNGKSYEGKEVPQYRLAPDWRLLTDEELEDTDMLYLVSYARDLLDPNQEHIIEPLIRERCIENGWIKVKS